MKVTVEIHSSGLPGRFERAVPAAVFKTAEQALKDCNYFCKQDYSGLIFSSVIHTSLEGTVNTSEIPDREMHWAQMSPGSDLKTAVLRWAMPYAARQYNLPSARTDKNPNARQKWCEAGYSAYGDNWQREFVNTLHREGL